MTYSRSRTQQKQKSQRRNKTRLLLAVNGILIVCIIAVAAFVWKSAAEKEASNESGQLKAHNVISSAEGSTATSSPSATDGEEQSSPSPAEEEEQYTEPEAPSDTISLAFVGDVLPAARVLDLMKSNGFDYPFREARAVLEAADITAGNLETPITTRGEPAKNKQYVFQGSAEAIPAIKEAGFDFLSLANNHTLDHGWEGLSDTMDALDDAEIDHAGSGNDDREAFSPAYIESKGMTVGFVSLTRVVPDVSWKADRNHPGVAEAYSPERAIEAIKEAKQNADIVVVMVHWGVERVDRPLSYQTVLAHQFVDAGADLIIGGHPHVLQGFEAYKGKWIAYSLGNFVFSSTSVKSSETGVLKAECGKDGTCSLSFDPMFATNSQPAPMEEAQGKQLLARLSELSYGASVEEDGAIVAQD